MTRNWRQDEMRISQLCPCYINEIMLRVFDHRPCACRYKQLVESTPNLTSRTLTYRYLSYSWDCEWQRAFWQQELVPLQSSNQEFGR